MRWALVFVAVAAAPAGAAEPTAGEKLFALTVKPLLAARCLACHGSEPAKLKGGLDLTSREKMLAGGDSGPAVKPGDAAVSPLYSAVHGADATMPPKQADRLTESEAWSVRDWVNAGAPWPDDARAAAIVAAHGRGVTVRTSGGQSPEWDNRRYDPADLWAYQAVRRPAAPEGVHPVDALLRVANPLPQADRRTLIRRATFDLLGLPPTPEEVEAFSNDARPDAYEQLIERLLASPHYGEQWGRHWLDVARYADSSGLANDYERGNAWRYRDYVVRAFNADKPYDRFVREQLAGDEIDPADPEKVVAAGFLRMGAWELTGMEVPKVARQRFLDDVTDAAGQVFLGHALQCCRCHDHKFDPVPTRDYYRVQAAFATTQVAERAAPFLPGEDAADAGEQKYLAARRDRYQEALRGLDAKTEAAGRRWAAERGLPYVPRQKGLRQGVPEAKLPPARVGLDTADLGLERIARKGLERLKWEADRFAPFALSVYAGRTPALKSVTEPLRVPADRSTAGELEQTRILPNGDPFSPGVSVEPGVLSAAGEAALPAGVEGRRRALADWVASPANPLTARVMVNRVWQWHFGRGLVETPNNFGAAGKKPTHPELLDWLASEFVRGSWSVKSLHRLVMLSAAYRRASGPGEGYAAFRPRRLDAEELRDAILAASGELNRKAGGVPVRPEINPDVATQPRQVMGTFAPAWQPSPRPEDRHRRSLYALKLRGLRDPFMEVFNQPTPESPCEGRDASTVTPQAFALFNASATLDRAVALALRLKRETSTEAGAVERAFRLALARPPTPAESAACLAHWRAMTRRHEAITLPKPAVPRELTREAVEENTGERFTFTEVLDAAADFVPDAKPADVPPEVRGLAEVCLVLFNSNEFAYLD